MRIVSKAPEQCSFIFEMQISNIWRILSKPYLFVKPFSLILSSILRTTNHYLLSSVHVFIFF